MLVIGVVMAQVLFSLTTPMTTTYPVTNESLGTVAVNVQESLAHSNLQSFDKADAYNATDGTFIATLASSDYSVDLANGYWTLTNATYDGDEIRVDYVWAESEYVTNGLARTIVPFLTVLFMIALLIAAVGWRR